MCVSMHGIVIYEYRKTLVQYIYLLRYNTVTVTNILLVCYTYMSCFLLDTTTSITTIVRYEFVSMYTILLYKCRKVYYSIYTCSGIMLLYLCNFTYRYHSSVISIFLFCRLYSPVWGETVKFLMKLQSIINNTILLFKVYHQRS